MRNQYRFTLYVDCPDGTQHSQAFNVDELMATPFSPYDLCDVPLIAIMTDGVISNAAAHIDWHRKQLAQQISAALTDGILKAIKSRDLHNGYETGEQ